MNQQDPIAELCRQQERKKLSAQALDDVARARIWMLRNSGHNAAAAFFGALTMTLEPKVDYDIPTAATNGEVLIVNPEWFCKLTHDQRIFVVAHEGLHPGLGHNMRRGHRDPKAWNVACDSPVNEILLESNMGERIPDMILAGNGPLSKIPKGLSAEEIYDLLPHDGESNGDGEGDGDGGGGLPETDAVKDASESAAETAQAEQNWKGRIAQAAQIASGIGKLPGALDQLVHDLLNPKVEWQDVLLDFIRSAASDDYSWMRPNKRHIQNNIILPGLHSDELGDIVLMVDSSGSVYNKQKEFASEMQGILDSFKCKATIIYCDAAVHHVEEWSSTDGPLKMEVQGGGGGTDHAPAFAEIDRLGLDPVCCVALTDLYTSFPSQHPHYPVLWAVCGGNKSEPPFGTVLHID